MGRKLFCGIITVIFVISVSMAVYAASGTIRVDIGGEGEITLYQVGAPEDSGHRLFGQYGGGFVTYDDMLSEDLAAWLSGRAQNGTTQNTKQGIAEFTGLEEGLYLVVQSGQREGYHSFSPFLISLPWDGDIWEAEVAPHMEPETAETPQTGDGLLIAICTLMVCLTGLTACVLWRKNY